MKIFSLAIQILHLLLVIFVTFFTLLTDKYDVYYFLFLLATVLHWNIFNGECIASYYEKKFINPNYKFGDAQESLFKQILGKNTTNSLIYSNIIVIIFLLYRNYGKPTFKTILVLALFIIILYNTSTKIKFKNYKLNSLTFVSK
jgi:hypothetical protein